MTINTTLPGYRLKKDISNGNIVPLIGVHDVFSASIAARHFNGIFVSGFSFAASFYGLPDIGFIAWSDIVAFAQRLRTLLPEHHIIVDIDDGYCDPEVACHVVRQLEMLGASGVVLEDQQRPRKCGHLEGKQIMELDAYLEKLKQVLASRKDMLIVARTDATNEEEAIRRAHAFAKAGADAILVEAVKNIDVLKELHNTIDTPLVFNQIAGGKSPSMDLEELQKTGISLVNYSTPTLFAAQRAVEDSIKDLAINKGMLPNVGATVQSCNHLLEQNLAGLSLPK